MTEFKIGDKVKMKDYSLPTIYRGFTGNIVSIDYDDKYPYEVEVELENDESVLVSYCKTELELDRSQFTPPAKNVDSNKLIDKQEHYTNNAIQPIEIMRKNMTTEEYRGFLLGNLIKYPLRYKDKNGLEDLRKALTYLTWLIEDVEEKGL